MSIAYDWKCTMLPLWLSGAISFTCFAAIGIALLINRWLIKQGDDESALDGQADLFLILIGIAAIGFIAGIEFLKVYP